MFLMSHFFNKQGSGFWMTKQVGSGFTACLQKGKMIVFGIGLIFLLVACQEKPANDPVTQSSAETETAESSLTPQPSVVILWNEVMLAAVRTNAPRPTVTARSLFMVHQAMYDAWALYDATATPTVLDARWRRPADEQTEANKEAAVSQAAYQMLLFLYPTYEINTQAFSHLLNTLGYEPTQPTDMTTPSGIGAAAAQAIITARANDGSNATNNFADITSDTYPELYKPVNSSDSAAPNGLYGPDFNPIRWQPLRVPTGKVLDAHGNPVVDPNQPDSYKEQTFLTPHWGAVTPFALTAGNQFRPSPPPTPGSQEPYTDGLGRTMTNDEAYHLQLDEVLHISANLTDEQKVIAEYWADGPRSETPPGHWNALTHGISYRDHHTLDEDVKLFFALNGALFDASIAAWDSKRAYDCIRPISAIQRAYLGQMITAWNGPDLGTGILFGEMWRPYQELTFVTPAFPEYVSGHSTFSAAAAAVLTRYTGSNGFYDGVTLLYNEDFNRDGLPDLLGEYIAPIGSSHFESTPSSIITLQWVTFQEAADEAGISRLYGGIHFQDGDLMGRAMGTQIGEQAFALAEGYWSGGEGN